MCRKCVWLFFLFLLSVPGMAQTNRALIVAIDEYPAGSGWAKIHATNDLKLILPMLADNGYPEENVVVLTNQNATKSAVIRELRQLVEHTGRGDHVYIHFSCHG